MKILCVDRTNTIRAPGMVKILDEEFERDAFSVGLCHTRALELGLRWADVVIVVNAPESIEKHVRARLESLRYDQPKVVVAPTGPSGPTSERGRYKSKTCPRLTRILRPFLTRLVASLPPE